MSDADATVVQMDVTVVGGGLAGVCAAVAAAREGSEVALVNDRPVLGGNSSSEIRVWANGATGGRHNEYAREGGIMEEIVLENKAQNPDGNVDRWDAVLQDLVDGEERLSVYLNTLIDEVETDGTTVEWVAGSQNMTERRFRFESPLFVDATGDGVVAAATDAEWRQGREAADEYGERAAPEAADEKTLGSSIMFYTEDAGEPVEFTPPDFAHDFREDPPSVLAKRADPEDRRCMYWWFEYGGRADLDPIADNEAIRDELWAMAYGAWDYIKNGPAFPEEDVETLRLDWVGKIPGKRESRRFLGDYVLSESDLVEQRDFDDAVGHGGWSIDLHPPAGFYDDQGRGSEHWHLDGPYQIPYRCLYPETTENFLLVGRHVSASHVAFGSVRVQMTLATLGQAAGTAAAIAWEIDATPRDVSREHRSDLQQRLLREDQWVMGERNRDDADLARDAEVTASDWHPCAVETADDSSRLEDPVGLHVSADGHVDAVEMRVRNDGDEAAEIPVAVHAETKPENYVPDALVQKKAVTVPAGGARWVEVPVDADPGDGQGFFLVVGPAADVALLARSGRLPGIWAGARTDGHEPDMVDGGRDVAWHPWDSTPCVRLRPEQRCFAPEAATDGFSRPYGIPHGWTARFEAADDGAAVGDQPWLALSWSDSRDVAAVQLAFDTRLTTNYNPLTPTDEPRVAPCVRDYRIEARVDRDWTTVHRETGNYRRFRRHVFDAVETDRLRLVVEATNGADRATVFELRAYGPDPGFPLEER